MWGLRGPRQSRAGCKHYWISLSFVVPSWNVFKLCNSLDQGTIIDGSVSTETSTLSPPWRNKSCVVIYKLYQLIKSCSFTVSTSSSEYHVHGASNLHEGFDELILRLPHTICQDQFLLLLALEEVLELKFSAQQQKSYRQQYFRCTYFRLNESSVANLYMLH